SETPTTDAVPKAPSPKQPKSSPAEIEAGIENVAQEIAAKEEVQRPVYVFPPLDLMKKGSGKTSGDSEEHLRQTAKKLQETLHNFGVNVKILNVSCGPTVTRYELQPEMGVKVSKIVSLTDDIKLNLACADIRMEAPIPGKAAIGIEVPNKENVAVPLRDLLESSEFQNSKSKLSFAAGKDIAGKPVVTDIAKMPHLLIAGATGSGKSVCINTLIVSLLYKANPDEVKLIMVDPKVVELSVYNGIPHLLIPVVTDPKKAAGALNWAVQEMTQRYNTFAEYNVRNLGEYNRKIQKMDFPEGEERPKPLPQIVIIVDELADLMMVAPGEVEDAICRLAQLARAAGIHLIIATQRPSVNVITGLIKANMPSRIAFAVSSGVDSRTILDMNGAEKLLGKGDMLFYPQGMPKPARLQGAFVSDEEVSDIVDFLKNRNPKSEAQIEQEKAVQITSVSSMAGGGNDELDVYFTEAGKFIIEKDKASIGMLQRMFKIGFNRAARIMDQLSDAGVVGPEEGTKPRKILMSEEQFENYLEQHG
ncbi:MAG: DNA translocase FtsK, partial [Eubacteriales bacterium]|nr:DNA translocase FtsK [Eubacteriales bacterium]